MKTFQNYIELLDVKLYFYIFTSAELAQYKAEAIQNHNPKTEWDSENAALTLQSIEDPAEFHIMFLREDLCPPSYLIAHEAFHATNFIMDYLETPLCEETREMWALTVEYISRFLSEQLNKEELEDNENEIKPKKIPGN